MNEYEMYCNQCQEAYQGEACQTVGMCGKDPELSALQDLLVYTARGVAIYTREIRRFKTPCNRPNHYVLDALFATITNANFDKQAIVKKIQEGLELREHVRGALQKAGKPAPALQHHDAATWMAFDEQELLQKSRVVGLRHTLGENEDRRSLAELLTYGLKGLAAYAEHAMNLGYTSAPLMTFIDEALTAPLYEKNGVPELLDWVLQCGKHGVDGMKLLDEANTTEYGHPQITEVALGVGTNPGILVSGHDLQDLEQLLIQSQGKGVDIYTHSEMLPAHYYPKLKKFSHLVGNYGNAWWQQTAEFSTFNGPILFTTNCIVPPRPNAPYLDKLYSTGSSGHPGFVHINSDAAGKKDFSQIIAHAQKCAPPTAIEQGSLVGGFARNQIGLLATKVIQAVQSGAIKEFVVMAGCDGRQSGRNYYTDYAQSLQQDTVILTAGCAKYRYNKLDLGHIDGIPRVLDAGQCNDSYSLVSTALTLQDALQIEDINDLPISYNIAWYEQKAVIVLLALLYLGVKNIQLGPTLPAFLSPGVGKVLAEQFGLHAPAQVA